VPNRTNDVLELQVPGFNTAVGCVSLTTGQWILCIVLGLSEIPVNYVLTFIEPQIPEFIIRLQPGKVSADEDDGVPLLPMGKASSVAISGKD